MVSDFVIGLINPTAGTVQRFRQVIPHITEDIVAALRLCTNITSATWVDDTLTPEANFLPILDVLMTLPLRELTIRTQYDPGERVWSRLNTIQGIRRLSVWSLEWGPPRVLQGWADLLSSSLTYLELGVRGLFIYFSLSPYSFHSVVQVFPQLSSYLSL